MALDLHRHDEFSSFLFKEYVENKRSIYDIAAELGRSYHFVRTKMIKFGVPRRGTGEANVGRVYSEESIQKMRDSTVRNNKKPEVKARRSEGQKKMWANMSREEILKRTTPGNTQRTKNAQRTKVSSIEIKIRMELDNLCIRYVHQKPINKGKFVLDFYLPDFDLVIECNGDYWHNLPERIERDKRLKKYIENKGKKIVFIWEHEINENPKKALIKALKGIENNGSRLAQA